MPINKNYDPAIDPFVFSWEILDVFIRGQSPIDVYSFMGQLNDEEDIADGDMDGDNFSSEGEEVDGFVDEDDHNRENGFSVVYDDTEGF
jgi:hypothetical protein